jgi:hypothetical protein
MSSSAVSTDKPISKPIINDLINDQEKGKLEGRNVEQLPPSESSQATEKKDKKKKKKEPKENTVSKPQFFPAKTETRGDKVCRIAKWIVIAVAVVALAVGIIGLLSYIGVLQLGLKGVGTISSITGLYTMLAGFGASLIISILLGVSCLLPGKSKKKETSPTEPIVDANKETPTIPKTEAQKA